MQQITIQAALTCHLQLVIDERDAAAHHVPLSQWTEDLAREIIRTIHTNHPAASRLIIDTITITLEE